ncbi:replication-relaxation family protein [Spiroplasma melliferum]|uniref:Uncharacterized protein n=3 Tax=Spiroplasma melliferum TaxID=2134 RepID=A0AAI9T1K2_SPIME|nr:replication-relaxation family protein [Spiroplasma melliferum]KAI92016.1 hypothetical protein SPM_006600 [Spiroplasma melliferum KC3]QCO23187.1 hypothetical protein SRED_003049 [Spiroplasma melliferum]QCO23208.1 hypothetical protein SRED_003070 [Spiroplasma melliferum]
MTESLKILDLLNKWGYLTAEQIALLLNKPIESAKTNLKTLQKKQLYKIDKTTRKNIYFLSHKGNTFVGRVHKKSIKVNYYELAHQDMLIKWLCSQTDIEHYQTERELKMENGNLNAYPDLIITKNDDSEIYVEFERTQKSPSRFKKKLDGHTKWLRNGGQIYWITPTQTLANWIQRQIDKDDFKIELQQVIIWSTQ